MKQPAPAVVMLAESTLRSLAIARVLKPLSLGMMGAFLLLCVWAISANQPTAPGLRLSNGVHPGAWPRAIPQDGSGQQEKAWWLVFQSDTKTIAVREEGQARKELPHETTQVKADISPDGKRRVQLIERPKAKRVRITDLDGSNPTEIVGSPNLERVLAWSPDGKWLALSTARDGDQGPHLHLLEIATSTFHILDYGRQFTWRPKFAQDGKLAYVARHAQNGKIPVEDLMVTEGPSTFVVARNTMVLDFAFSPDGRKLAYSDGAVKIIDLQTRKVEKVFECRDVAQAGWNQYLKLYRVHWRPDGQAVVCEHGFLGGRTVGTKIPGEDYAVVYPWKGKPQTIHVGHDMRFARWFQE